MLKYKNCLKHSIWRGRYHRNENQKFKRDQVKRKCWKVENLISPLVICKISIASNYRFTFLFYHFIMKIFKHISRITELNIWIPVHLSPRFYHHDFFVFPLLYMYPYITLLFIINPPFYFFGGIFHCKLQTLMHFPLNILVSK